MSKASIRRILKNIKHQSLLNIRDYSSIKNLKVKQLQILEKSSKDVKTIDYLLNCLEKYEKPKDITSESKT